MEEVEGRWPLTKEGPWVQRKKGKESVKSGGRKITEKRWVIRLANIYSNKTQFIQDRVENNILSLSI